VATAPIRIKYKKEIIKRTHDRTYLIPLAVYGVRGKSNGSVKMTDPSVACWGFVVKLSLHVPYINPTLLMSP